MPDTPSTGPTPYTSEALRHHIMDGLVPKGAAGAIIGKSKRTGTRLVETWNLTVYYIGRDPYVKADDIRAAIMSTGREPRPEPRRGRPAKHAA